MISSNNIYQNRLPEEITDVLCDFSNDWCWFIIRSGIYLVSSRLRMESEAFGVLIELIYNSKEQFVPRDYKLFQFKSLGLNPLLKKVDKQEFIEILNKSLGQYINDWQGLSYYGGDECYQII